MRNSRKSRLWRLGLRDFLLCFAVFLALFAVPSGKQRHWSPPHASASELVAGLIAEAPASLSDGSTSVVKSGSIGKAERSRAMVLLGLSFSLLMTFNLAILRYLRRAFAAPRRRMWWMGR